MATNVKIDATDLIALTYDLSDGSNISASDIAANSNGSLKTFWNFPKIGVHPFPNTTLLYNGTIANAKIAFDAAFAKSKPENSKAKVSRLLILKVSPGDPAAYIE
jgi:hypothetical protein